MDDLYEYVWERNIEKRKKRNEKNNKSREGK
jgi:hypothetical protein